MRFIQVADLHGRGETPLCRLDENWIKSQQVALHFVVETANKRKLPIFILGDVFQTARCSTEVVNMFISELLKAKYGVKILPGNHDLPYHNYAQVHTSSIGTLLLIFPELKTDVEKGYTASPFGLDEESDLPLRFIHRLIFPDEASRPVDECGQTASELLEEFPNQQWIFTGDYHHKFHYEENGRHVVNTGCLNIQAGDMIDYTPVIAEVDTEAGTVEWIEVPNDPTLLTDDYLKKQKERADRMENVVTLIRQNGNTVLDFDKNLEVALAKADPDVATEVIGIQQEVQNESK